MTIELILPDVKFPPGSLVKFPNENNDKAIFLKIHSVEMNIGLRYLEADVSPPPGKRIRPNMTERLEGFYHLHILPGSIDEFGQEIQPDTWLCFGIQELEERCEAYIVPYKEA